MAKNNRVQELLTRGVEKVIVKEHLQKRLEKGDTLTLKFGIDPTGADLHIGHMVAIRKLRAFQELGHKVVIVIGDFTGRIGDPSGRDIMREPLTETQINENLKTYQKQISTILDVKKTRFAYQSEWFDKSTLADVMNWSGAFTVQQMLDRDMYQKRLKEGNPIGVHEFMYPLLQAYDSVAIKADVEFGARDQEFNLLVGRTMQTHYKQKPQDILTTPLLMGNDGRKMSKTYDNYIAVNAEPKDMFGKVMSSIDDIIIDYFTLATDVPMDEIKEMEKEMKSGKLNPRDAKARLAREIVSIYHDEKAAIQAEQEFEKVFKSKEKPTDIPKFKPSKKTYKLADLLVDTKCVQSKKEAKRVIEQKGVRINDKVVEEWDKDITPKKGMIIQVGKRKFVQIG